MNLLKKTNDDHQLSDNIQITESKTDLEFNRIKEKLILGEKLIVVNNEECCQKKFFIDDKDYLDDSHDYFCKRAYVLEVENDEIVVENTSSKNMLDTFYQFKNADGESSLRWLTLTKNKKGVNFNTVKSLNTIHSNSVIHLPEHVFLASDLHLLKDLLKRKLSLYDEDILNYSNIIIPIMINMNAVETKNVDDINGNLFNHLEINYKVTDKTDVINYKSFSQLYSLTNNSIDLFKFINKLLRKELIVSFSVHPIFSHYNDGLDDNYSSIDDFKGKKIEELRMFILYFLNEIKEPHSHIFHLSAQYSKKELKTLEKIAMSNFDFLFKQEYQEDINRSKTGKFLCYTHLILNLKSIYMIDHCHRDKIIELKILSNYLKIDQEGNGIIVLNTIIDDLNIEIQIIGNHFFIKEFSNVSFYFSRNDAVKHSIDTIKFKKRRIAQNN